MFAELDKIFSSAIFWQGSVVIVALVSLFFTMWHKRNGYRTEADCENFRKSVKESLERGNKRFTKTEKCLIFLVEKQEPGAAAEMGLYD